MLKIVTIVGARPQFVKAAVLRELFEMNDKIQEVLIHTGQHYDVSMSDVFFSDLNIKPAEYKLGINSGGQGQTTGRMTEEIERVIIAEKPDAVLVYGDTNSTLAGALAASKLHIPVIHVEAGLRSFNKRMPEEINRVLTDHVSELLFCSTHAGVENLKRENIQDNVVLVGDIMYDATLKAIRNISDIESIQGVDLRQDNLAACTVHRAENTDDETTLRKLIEYLDQQCDTYNVVLPVHPRTSKALEQFDISTGRITTIEPVGYHHMQALLNASKMVFTDSGGLQKEAYFHQVPCVTLRNETEWVELITAGWNRLWSTPDFKRPRQNVEEYGTGNCGQKIIQQIERFFLP